jgi:hypothetical protein
VASEAWAARKEVLDRMGRGGHAVGCHRNVIAEGAEPEGSEAVVCKGARWVGHSSERREENVDDTGAPGPSTHRESMHSATT